MSTATASSEVSGHVGSGMWADAKLVTELRTTQGGNRRSCGSALRSDAPLVLRLTRAKTPEPWAASAVDVVRVSLAAGAACPVGGDRLTLDVVVGAGSSLVLSEVSPTLLLPGPHGQPSRTQVRIRVSAGATMIWLAEPVIAARGCDHHSDVRVHLEEGARKVTTVRRSNAHTVLGRLEATTLVEFERRLLVFLGLGV